MSHAEEGFNKLLLTPEDAELWLEEQEALKCAQFFRDPYHLANTCCNQCQHHILPHRGCMLR